MLFLRISVIFSKDGAWQLGREGVNGWRKSSCYQSKMLSFTEQSHEAFTYCYQPCSEPVLATAIASDAAIGVTSNPNIILVIMGL